MAVLPIQPPDRSSVPVALDDFRDGEATVVHPPVTPEQAKRIADLATAASRLESLISATYNAYDDMSTGRTSDLPRKSQRVTDMLTMSREEARRTLGLAYELLAESQR